MIAIAAKAYLFLLRVRAVYGKSRIATVLLAVGWIIVVGSRMGLEFVISISVSLKPNNECNAISFIR